MFQCIKEIKGIKKDEIIPSEQIEQNETHRMLFYSINHNGKTFHLPTKTFWNHFIIKEESK